MPIASLIEEFSDELPRTLRANPIVEVPADVLLVNRVMGLMSGIGKTLDSQVNLFATLMPFTQSLMIKMSEKEPGVAKMADTKVGDTPAQSAVDGTATFSQNDPRNTRE